MALPAEAQHSCTGVIRVIFATTVRTIRRPPIKVPSPMAAWQVMATQNGTRSTAIMPMVFCASLPPCPREMPSQTEAIGNRLDSSRIGTDEDPRNREDQE